MSYEIRSILYASDLTPRSPAVFLHAVGLAKKFNAKLHAVTVTLPSTSLPYEEFISEEKMDEIKLAGHKKAEALLRKRIEVFAETNPDLDVNSVRLMTNNPAKSDFLNQAGIKVNSYVPIIVGEAAQNQQYLETKRARMGHIIPEVKA